MHDHVSVVNDEQREENCASSSEPTSRRITVEKQLVITRDVMHAYKVTKLALKNASNVFQNANKENVN